MKHLMGNDKNSFYPYIIAFKILDGRKNA